MALLHSDALQSTIYQRLSDDAKLVDDWGLAIFDVPPQLGETPQRYIRIGDGIDNAMHAQGFAGSKGMFEIAIFSKAGALREIKEIAGHIVGILRSDPPAIADGKIFGFWFQRAQTQRLQKGNLHVVRLWFRVMIDANEQ